MRQSNLVTGKVTMSRRISKCLMTCCLVMICQVGVFASTATEQSRAFIQAEEPIQADSSIKIALANQSDVTGEQGFNSHGNKDTGTWVVVLKDPRSERRKGWSGGVGYRSNRPYDKDPSLNKLAQSIVKEYSLDLLEQWPIKSLNVHCLVVKFDEIKRPDLVNRLTADQRVKWMQLYQEFELLDEPSKSAKRSFDHEVSTVNQTDPYRKLQTAFKLLNLDAVTQMYRGEGVTIAMIDSGIELEHSDLAGANIEHIDIVGIASNETSKAHLEHHGTGVAGIMVAQNNNAEGISGIAPKSKLVAFRSCWEDVNRKARCNTLTLSRALDQIIELKPDILNLSLTGPKDRLLDELTKVIVEKGTLIVAAYDSSRAFDQRFPSLSDNVFFAINESELIKDRNIFTDNTLVKPVFFSPGVDIITAQPGDTYAFMSGHSISSAHLSGVLSLIKQASPDVTHLALKKALINHMSNDADVMKLDVCGVLNALNALIECESNLPTVSINRAVYF